MRRLLAILLLVLLPLQFTWAAAAAYCQHETGVVASHLGHHEHVHSAAEGKSSIAKLADAKQDANFGVDDDCGYCHLMAAKLVPPAQSASPPKVLVSLPVLPLDARPVPSRDPDRHERPNWRIA